MDSVPGYSNKDKSKSVFSPHPGRELKPWIKELSRNPAITHLKVMVSQAVVWSCPRHWKGVDCDRVMHMRKATGRLECLSVGGVVEVVWDPRGWGIGKGCIERAEVWMRELGGKIGDKGGREGGGEERGCEGCEGSER